MKHHVTCAVCGKKDCIPVSDGAERKAGWFYGGKVNIRLSPLQKPKYVEYWECPVCAQPDVKTKEKI